MTYLNIKYQNNFEQITEEELANQISYWFFTTLLVPSKLGNKKRTALEVKQWKQVINGDNDLQQWYYKFVDEVIKFYNNRFKSIKKLESL